MCIFLGMISLFLPIVVYVTQCIIFCLVWWNNFSFSKDTRATDKIGTLKSGILIDVANS